MKSMYENRENIISAVKKNEVLCKFITVLIPIKVWKFNSLGFI